MYLIFVVFGYLFLEALSFLKEKERKVDLGNRGVGKELGRAERGEIVANMYCLREKSVFHKNRK